MATIRDVLIETKRVLETYGWVRDGWGRSKSGRPVVLSNVFLVIKDDDCCGLCLGAAVYISAERLDSDLRETMQWLLRHLPGAGESGGVITWNDSPVRTQAEVMELLDTAIAGLEEPGLAG